MILEFLTIFFCMQTVYEEILSRFDEKFPAVSNKNANYFRRSESLGHHVNGIGNLVKQS